MKTLTVYLLAYNESFLLPQVDKWWKERFINPKIIVYDNESIDNTVKLAQQLGWEVRTFSTGGKMSDLVQMNIKNECWKDCDTDFAWISDFDELPGFTQKELDNLSENISMVRMKGWEFIDVAYTIQDAQYGIQTDGYSKNTLIRPSKLIETNYEAGAHKCKPSLKEGIVADKILDLYHMKWFNPTHALYRASLLGGEHQSNDNKLRKWSYHFSLPLEDHLNYYKTHFANRIKIR